MFEIQKNVPMPQPAQSRYPFRSMKVGDSFGFSIDRLLAVRGAAYAYARKNNQKFKVAIEDKSRNAARCWRIK
jgi:hypothetical protein